MSWSDVGFGLAAVVAVAAGIGVFVVDSMARATWLLLRFDDSHEGLPRWWKRATGVQGGRVLSL